MEEIHTFSKWQLEKDDREVNQCNALFGVGLSLHVSVSHMSGCLRILGLYWLGRTSLDLGFFTQRSWTRSLNLPAALTLWDFIIRANKQRRNTGNVSRGQSINPWCLTSKCDTREHKRCLHFHLWWLRAGTKLGRYPCRTLGDSQKEPAVSPSSIRGGGPAPRDLEPSNTFCV